MILLSDPLPLRRAADLPVWLDDAPLPWVYGRVTLAPVCISTDRREWLLADHAIAGVTSVAAAGEPVSGWQHLNRLDDNGRAIAVLRTSQPVKEGVQLAVACTGALDERSGEVIEHPAAIARDLYDSGEYYQIINRIDPIFNEAVRVMKDEKLYKSKLQPSK